LIAIAVARKGILRAIEFMCVLLDENQRPLTEKLSAIVREACEKWAGGVSETATSDVAAAIRTARELAYL